MEYNLYLEETGRTNQYRLHLSAPPKNAKTGIAIKWPVNPEFTGKEMIKTMLSEIDHCKNWVII